ncbi:MAG: 16S rRNA (adenine(1518)-N(6)/adenine(1519)-N(6))-dimethyltransferase RsmA [bacterium]|nr:16S rRNA (adenine(1518)-N(6)/adenine(1519)-N(6))-dimethyltransferase RsmA [bacterium]
MSPQDWRFIQKNPSQALTDVLIIQKLCEQFGIRPTRAAGQNFLIEARIARAMAECAEIGKDDTILEIGSGLGALTVVLAEQAGQVIAVEKDPRVFAAAKKILEQYKNVELTLGDILKIPLSPPLPKGEDKEFSPAKGSLPFAKGELERDLQKGRGREGFKLVSNLPYSITSAVLRKFTEEEPKPELIVVMTQKEVAERVCAKPGEMSLLSVAVQFYAQPEIIEIVPRRMFWPIPEVDSAILKIKIPLIPPFTKWEDSRYSPFQKGRDREEFTKKFFQIVRIGFSSRRKQLQNNLAAGLRLPNEEVKQILAKAGFDPRVRAQDLGVEEWARLVERLTLGSRYPAIAGYLEPSV